MKKIIALLAAVVLLCGMLSGCEGESKPEPTVTAAPAETEVETFVVHAFVPESWGDAYIWAWSDSYGDAFEAWPGEKMVPDGGGWYTFEVPEWVEGIVISGLDGTVQTGDISIESREVWVGMNPDSTLYLDYVPFEMPQGGYIEMLEGEWESVYLKENSFDINANAMVYPEMIENCYEMTVHIDIEMLGGTSCKDWQVWIRSGGTFVKLEQMYLEAGDGYTYETFTFDTPISFDAIAVTAKASGGYSYYAGIAVTDVWYEL